MSIYDRDYMRFARPKTANELVGDFFRRFPATAWLIAVNLAAFVLSVFAPAIMGVLELSPRNLAAGMFWTPITYAFLHGGLFHIMCNMLGLYFMGRAVEKWIGAARYLALYFSGVAAGGLLWTALFWNAPANLVGASAGVVAVFACFCALHPPVPITFLIFFILPISIKPITMLKVAAVFEAVGLASSLFGGGTEVAYAAHLGGLAVGALWGFSLRGASVSASFKNGRIAKFFERRKGGKSASDYKFTVNISPDVRPELDRILDKISREGFSSLTEQEREFLRRSRGQ